jgi:hypothetical protein
MRSVRRRIRQLRLGFVGPLLTLALLFEFPVSARAYGTVTRSLDEALELDAGASCLDRQRLLANLELWLGHVPLQGVLRILVTGDASDKQRVTYEIRHVDRVERREFQPAPASCDDLHTLLGMSLALVLEKERMQQTWLLPPPPPQELTLWSAQFSLSHSLLLDSAYGLQLGADIGLTSLLHLRVEVLGQLARNNTIPNSKGTFDLWFPAAAFEVCAGAQLYPSMRFALCSGALLGAIIGHGLHGYAPNNTVAGAWLGWRTGVRFDVLLGLHWLIDVDVVSRIYSPAIVVESQYGLTPERHEPGSTGVALSIGPALSF